jgi:hypothetical protein
MPEILASPPRIPHTQLEDEGTQPASRGAAVPDRDAGASRHFTARADVEVGVTFAATQVAAFASVGGVARAIAEKQGSS